MNAIGINGLQSGQTVVVHKDQANNAQVNMAVLKVLHITDVAGLVRAACILFLNNKNEAAVCSVQAPA